MCDYRSRLISENKELKERLAKLTKFIGESDVFEKLPEKDRMLLLNQQYVMKHYRDILKERVARAVHGK